MKVTVREEKRIDVRQTSSDFEAMMVPILLMYVTEKFKVTKIKVDAIDPDEPTPRRQLDWHQVFELLPIALQDRRVPSTSPVFSQNLKTLEVKLDLPSLDFVKEKLTVIRDQIRKLPKRILYASAGGAIVLAALLIWFISRPGNTAPDTGSIQAPALHRGTPNYPTILPSGENINQLGGWVRISPPNRAPVYTYIDHINGVQVDVSEQPLPSKLQSNPALYQLAQNFGADSKLDAGGTIFYVGTGADDAQSVIMAKDNLLILMKSVQIVPNDKWISYINSMQ